VITANPVPRSSATAFGQRVGPGRARRSPALLSQPPAPVEALLGADFAYVPATSTAGERLYVHRRRGNQVFAFR